MKHDLLHGKLSVVNVGLDLFTPSLTLANVPFAHLDWRPPGDGDPKLAWALAQLTGDPDDPDAAGSLIDCANDEATGRMLAPTRSGPNCGRTAGRHSRTRVRRSRGRACATR
jgi:hypothetical protein